MIYVVDQLSSSRVVAPDTVVAIRVCTGIRSK
jgi:hypothetical protein